MKTLVVINGVTGAIGSACLARLSREENVVVIGLSRKALFAQVFCEQGYFPENTLICSLGDITRKEDCVAFTQRIDKTMYTRIIYIHAVGTYPFELNDAGDVCVSHDEDGDGIDDRVTHLSHDAFFAMTDALQNVGLPITAFLFGAISDKFQPAVHQSWWKTMGKIRIGMHNRAQQDDARTFVIMNISSVICPNELISRPFVFQRTNADARFWLMPHEVADRVAMLFTQNIVGIHEEDLYHHASYYEDDYFQEEKFTTRKCAELGILPS